MIVAQLCDRLGISDWRQSKHNLRKIKRLYRKAQKLKRSTSKDEKKKAIREEVIKEAYRQYIEVVKGYINRVEETLKKIKGGSVVNVAMLMLVENYIKHAQRQIDQIERRVLKGEKIPHNEKVFSIFEEHTEWICKGKAGVSQELGLKVSVVSDQYGFILHHRVMQKQTDEEIAVPIIKETKERFSTLSSCSFDKGYYSPQNQEGLKEILDIVILPKKGKLSQKDKEREYTEEFRTSRKEHSAVESSINALENHALDRCPDHGIYGFKRYVGLAVLARNLQILGNIVQEKARKTQKRREKLKETREKKWLQKTA